MESLDEIKRALVLLECIFFAMSFNIQKEARKVCYIIGCLFLAAALIVIVVQQLYINGYFA